MLFGLARDLDLIQVVGHDADGNDITRSTRFSNVSWVFYLGYLGKFRLSSKVEKSTESCSKTKQKIIKKLPHTPGFF